MSADQNQADCRCGPDFRGSLDPRLRSLRERGRRAGGSRCRGRGGLRGRNWGGSLRLREGRRMTESACLPVGSEGSHPTRPMASLRNPYKVNPKLLNFWLWLDQEWPGQWVPEWRVYAEVIPKKRRVPWRIDFACPGRMVAVEVEGLRSDTVGYHQSVQGFTGDCYKYNEAVLQGWSLIRVTHKMIEQAMKATGSNQERPW